MFKNCLYVSPSPENLIFGGPSHLSPSFSHRPNTTRPQKERAARGNRGLLAAVEMHLEDPLGAWTPGGQNGGAPPPPLLFAMEILFKQ